MPLNLYGPQDNGQAPHTSEAELKELRAQEGLAKLKKDWLVEGEQIKQDLELTRQKVLNPWIGVKTNETTTAAEMDKKWKNTLNKGRKTLEKQKKKTESSTNEHRKEYQKQRDNFSKNISPGLPMPEVMIFIAVIFGMYCFYKLTCEDTNTGDDTKEDDIEENEVQHQEKKLKNKKRLLKRS